METLPKCVFLLIALVVSAEEEDFLSQREAILDLSDLLGDDFITVKEVPLEYPVVDREATLQGAGDTDGRPRFSPRSRGSPQIPFPLARPKSNNIQAICRYSKQRPRYPKESLPRSGFGYLHRQANAVNQLESWLSGCCRNGSEDEELTLCCAEQAWKKSLSAFCDEEFSVKTSHYHCCKKKGSEKWACFEMEAPDRSYQPSSHESWADIPSMSEDFSFNPATCKKSHVGPRALKGTVTAVMDTFFPHGRPNSDNIGSICANRKHQRQFFSRCLPRKGDSTLTQKAKAINDLEKGFNQCCKKKERQACAERKWKMMVDEFCMNGDGVQFACCEKGKGEKLYDCFAAAAPNPDYIPHNESMSVSRARPTLDMFCDMYSTYHTMQREIDLSLEMLAGRMVKQCCPPKEERNPACLQTELDNILDEECDTWRFMSCCKMTPKSRAKCVTKHVLGKLAEGNSQNYSSRKKCPVFF